MAIGRPIELTPNVTQKNISVACTEGQTEFTVTDGYRINELAVYRNGVRLVDGRDFSATNGQTVTLISDTVIQDDIIEFSVLDSFDVAGVIVGAASSQTLNGNLHITGELYTGTFSPAQLNVSGIATATKFVGDLSDAVTGRWAISNNGSSNYVFTGPGGLSAASNSTLYLARGQTYEFNMNASGHGFGVQTSSGTWNASNEYTTGITNAKAAVGVIKFEVPYTAPNTLYYACTSSHSGMVGSLVIYPSI